MSEQPRLESLKAIYSQDEDCCGRNHEDIQEIEIEIIDNGVEQGGYIVIKTERWTFDKDDKWLFNECNKLLKYFDSYNNK